jgi:hypothetical protein
MSAAASAGTRSARSSSSIGAARASTGTSPPSIAEARTRAARVRAGRLRERWRYTRATLVPAASGAPGGRPARRWRSWPSSRSASGFPPVSRWRRSASSRLSGSSAWRFSNSPAEARSRPARRRVGTSAPSSSDGSPWRTASTTATGSATRRRNAKSMASALDPSSQCASSTSTATGVSSE